MKGEKEKGDRDVKRESERKKVREKQHGPSKFDYFNS